MATITFLAYAGGAARPAFTSASAIGIGYNSSAYPNNIQKGYVGRYACVTTGVGINAIKSGGINYISVAKSTVASYYWTTAGGSYSVSAIATVDAGGFGGTTGPDTEQTIRIYFTHGAAVNANPVQIWIDSAGGGAGYTFASVWVMEASATGSQNWTQASPGNKLTLTPFANVATAHSWYVGASLKPQSDLVGFNDDCYIQFSITYA